MKKYDVFIIAAIIITASVIAAYAEGFFGGRVYTKKDNGYKGDPCVITYGWYNGNIVYSSYDNIDSCVKCPNLLSQRKKEAELIFEKYNSIK